MAKWRCSLCGGKLSEGRCILCGLDNTIYKRETAYSGGASQEESRQKQKQQSYSAGRAVRPANNRKTKSGRLTIIVILLIPARFLIHIHILVIPMMTKMLITIPMSM